MRMQTISNLVVCAWLCLPALAIRGDEKQALRENLSRTVNELATFTDLGRRIEAHDAKAVVELLAATEAGPSDQTAAEAEMVALRTRVNALQEILDARAIWVADVALAPGDVKPAEDSALHPQTAPTTIPASIVVNAAAGSKTAFETKDFVADRTKLGRACWRGGRYLEGVAALEPLAGEPKADYWRARCLEKLARNGEALELYKKVIETSGDSPEGKSAREDREFLEWSIGHGLVSTP